MNDPQACAAGAGAGFRHEVLLYAGEQQYLQGTLPFITGGVAAKEPVMVAVRPARIALLRSALGADERRVRFADMREVGRNPGRIIALWHDYICAAGGR